MIFNTNTLGYKLVSGQLAKRRKHSEQLNKYVAGLFDTDGYVGFEFIVNRVYLRAGISQAASVDNDFELLRSLHEYYMLGTLTYTYNDRGVSMCHWRFSTKDCQTFFNRIGKHLRIKGTHFRNLLAMQKAMRLEFITEDLKKDLQQYSKESRKNTKWLKRPKHLSYAWVAGFIDGDGSYRIRRRDGKIKSLCVKASVKETFILQKLKEDFKGSLNRHSEDLYTWRRGLGKGHMNFSLPFLKKMRKYSCLRTKYGKIEEMIRYLQTAKTKQLELEESKQ